MIDDGGSSQGAQMGPNSGYGMSSKQNFDEHHSRFEYNMPGILHFLQTEWAKFEMERAQWDVEKAELQVGFCICLFGLVLIELFITGYY